MLAQLRVTAEMLLNGKEIYFSNPNEAQNYFRSFIASMMYFSGGHSFLEFTSPLQIEEVADWYNKRLNQEILGERINIDSLFKEGNKASFDSALKPTIEYNKQLFKKQAVHEELRRNSLIFSKNTNTESSSLKNDANIVESKYQRAPQKQKTSRIQKSVIKTKRQT